MATIYPSEKEGYKLSARQFIMYPDLNAFGRIFGGRLLSWMDEALAMYAVDVTGTANLVTRHMSEVDFRAPGQLGDILEIWAKPIKKGNTSLQLEAQAWVRRDHSGVQEREQICSCKMVFVVLDENGTPCSWSSPEA